MTDDQQQPDTDDGQCFQFQIRDMMLVTFVAALFFGLFSSAPGGILVATAGTMSCGAWLLLRQQSRRISGARDYVDSLMFVALTFALECLVGWTVGVLGLISIGMPMIYPFAIGRALLMPIVGINAIWSFLRLQRRPHGLVQTVVLLGVTAGLLPFVGMPAMYAGHVHYMHVFAGRRLAPECLELVDDATSTVTAAGRVIRPGSARADECPPAIARLNPDTVEVQPNSVRISSESCRYTFERLDSDGNWALRCCWSAMGDYRTVATIHEGECR